MQVTIKTSINTRDQQGKTLTLENHDSGNGKTLTKLTILGTDNNLPIPIHIYVDQQELIAAARAVVK